MNFELINNHIVLAVETEQGAKRCIFDTGSPISFLFDCSVGQFKLDGKPFTPVADHMSNLLNLFWSDIENMIGTKIDGIIGTGCFSSSNVLIDFIDHKLTITTERIDESYDVSMTSKFGLPIFEMKINGATLKAAYDSGAMYSFVKSNMAEHLSLTPQDRSFEDFNPMLGHFTANLYTGNIQIGTTELCCRNIATSASYDSALQLMGVDAFLGTDALEQSIICLSYIAIVR